MNQPFQLNLLRRQADLLTWLRDAHDARKVLVYELRVTKELFEASEAADAILKPDRPRAELVYSLPRDGQADHELLAPYILGRRPCSWRGESRAGSRGA